MKNLLKILALSTVFSISGCDKPEPEKITDKTPPTINIQDETNQITIQQYSNFSCPEAIFNDNVGLTSTSTINNVFSQFIENGNCTYFATDTSNNSTKKIIPVEVVRETLETKLQVASNNVGQTYKLFNNPATHTLQILSKIGTTTINIQNKNFQMAGYIISKENDEKLCFSNSNLETPENIIETFSQDFCYRVLNPNNLDSLYITTILNNSTPTTTNKFSQALQIYFSTEIGLIDDPGISNTTQTISSEVLNIIDPNIPIKAYKLSTGEEINNFICEIKDITSKNIQIHNRCIFGDRNPEFGTYILYTNEDKERFIGLGVVDNYCPSGTNGSKCIQD